MNTDFSSLMLLVVVPFVLLWLKIVIMWEGWRLLCRLNRILERRWGT